MSTILDRVRHSLSEALYMSPEEIAAESRLINDLGMESIDFLDVIFRLEKEFKVSIPRGEFERAARDGLSDEEFAKDGVLTEAATLRLKSLLPEVPEQAFAGQLRLRDIPTLLTVKSLANIVEAKLKDSGASA